MESNQLNIQSLPCEIIVMVLNCASSPDIVSFGSTCKQFNELVKSSQILWKNSLKNTVSKSVFKEIEKQSEGNWYNAVRKYYILKSEIYARLIEMSASFYKYNNDITLHGVRQFLNNSFSNGLSFYCTIYILQELVRIGNRYINTQIVKKPFSLTEMYYAKVALQHMMHSYLAIKWIQGYLKRELPPLVVLNFFAQWVDPLKMHMDDEVNDAIFSVAKLVETELAKIRPSKTLSVKEMCANGEITESQIIAAISHVMYKVKRMTPLCIANLETLDIKKVIEMGCGHDIVIATIYNAIAKQFGLQCELIAFPNHLFLELHSKQPNNRKYKIELASGKLSSRGQCPFSRDNAMEDSYRYWPDAFLQFVISAFLVPMGSYKTWYMQNSMYLQDFLNTNPNSTNKYITYLPYLMENPNLPALTTPIYVTSLSNEHLKIIALLSHLTKSAGVFGGKLVVKKRSANLKYAVGMIVQHKEYGYVSVIKGWDLTSRDFYPSPSGIIGSYKFNPRGQLLYIVVAIDLSERYVSEEEIVEVVRPTRLCHVEDLISSEFTHFNGFAYEPNEHKRREYPDDMAVSEQYRTRASTLYGTNT